MDPELQESIDRELTRYQQLTTDIEQLEKDVARQMRNYEEIVNSYLNALHIVQPKMDSWRAPRREKMAKLCSSLRHKWGDMRTPLRNDPALDQEEQLFMAVLRIQYKKTAEQQAFQRTRQKLIRDELDKIVLPTH
jgi:tetrahydromethanopterin S-methyltransferase subunit B